MPAIYSRFAAVVGFSMLSSLASAASEGAAEVVALNVPASIEAPRFQPSVKLVVDTSVGINLAEPANFSGSYELSAGLANVWGGLNLRSSLAWSQEYSYEKDDQTRGNLGNLGITLGKKVGSIRAPLGSVIDAATLSLGGAIGAGRESARQTFLASIGPSVRFVKALRKFDLALGFGGSHRVYGEDVRGNGVVNSPWSAKSSAEVVYNISDFWSLAVQTEYSYTVSFQGVGRGAVKSSLSLDYSISKNISLSAGFESDRGTLDSTGKLNRFVFNDPNSTVAFFDLTLAM
jgi:hypothetical protein